MRRTLAEHFDSLMRLADMVPWRDVVFLCSWAARAACWGRTPHPIPKGQEAWFPPLAVALREEEKEVGHSPQKTVELIGRVLWDSYSRVSREMGLNLPELVRVPVLVSMGGWNVEGMWECHPLRGGWGVQGLLELQGNEPRGFYCSFDPGSGSCTWGEGFGG